MHYDYCRTRLWTVALVLVICGLGAGCVPPDLLEADDEAERQVEFLEVADIMRQSCANGSGCHGASSSTRFAVQGGAQATDEQVQAALDGVEDVVLVEPGDPSESLIYLRMNGEEGSIMPPIGGRLDEELIETVQLWIDQGANYD